MLHCHIISKLTSHCPCTIHVHVTLLYHVFDSAMSLVKNYHVRVPRCKVTLGGNINWSVFTDTLNSQEDHLAGVRRNVYALLYAGVRSGNSKTDIKSYVKRCLTHHQSLVY